MQTIDIPALPHLEFEDLEACCIQVDWRECETEIIESVAGRLAEGDELYAVDDDEDLPVIFNGAEHRIPLTFTPHDRYVAISSLAYILADRYQFWLLKTRLQDDTHSLLVLSVSDSAAMERLHPAWVSETLERLELGHDYFHGLSVPYLGREDNNPDFAAQAEALRQEHEECRELSKEVIEHAMKELGLTKGFALDGAKRKPWWKIW